MSAAYDLWIIGDGFLKDMIPSIRSLKTQATINKKKPPYMYEYFNIKFFHTYHASSTRNAIARIHNAVVEALNTNARLPAYILMMLDSNILETISYFEFGISKCIHRSLCSIFSDLEQMVKTRRGDLLQKKPGALGSSKHPQIIWIEMIEHPSQMSYMKTKIYNQRSKFNYVLNNMAKDAQHQIMAVNVCSLGKHFDLLGKLNTSGKETYWKEIDYQMKKFDRNEMKSQPNSN